jgi:imidazole glycerol-phosphate synthase subunit HisF
MRNKRMHAGAEKHIYEKARLLRRQLTSAEEVLWQYLKAKPLGYKFRRQHPYSIYILDFYCHQLKLVIEVDGEFHDVEEVKKNDQYRQALLEKDGLMMIRFTNNEVLHQMQLVMAKLENIISAINKC